MSKVFDIFQKTMKVINSITTEGQYFACATYLDLAERRIRELMKSSNKELISESEDLISRLNSLIESKYTLIQKDAERNKLMTKLGDLLTSYKTE